MSAGIRKTYVDVTANFTTNGPLTPRAIHWRDGRTFTVDRVLGMKRAASTRAGGVGILYTCRVSGREISLFYEENYRWFVEEKCV